MYEKRSITRICQGDVIEEFSYQFANLQEEPRSIISITIPYAIVLTQDCDLEQDYKFRNPTPENPVSNNDKYLQSILICPAYLSESFKQGNHLSALSLTMQTWGGDRWKYVKTNQNERYHFLNADITLSIPELIIDFKHYYTIPNKDLYSIHRTNYKASLASLYREDISHRFANYLSRIGLPL